MYLSRELDLDSLLRMKSFFLFGPRSSGKSSLIMNTLADKSLVFDLLESDLYLILSARPSELEAMIESSDKEFEYIIIDEIQKIPLLLDEVHRLIEKHKFKFLLTGSSARKLKRGGVNLLAGRAWRAEIFPLVSKEIPKLDLDRYLVFGGLPQVYLSENPNEELKAYVKEYLYEEIQAEALVRKVAAFSRFLTVAAVTSGSMLNFAALSSDVAIPASTVKEYYQILEDTLVGFMLPSFTHTIKRKSISTAKFYFFDVGVRNKIAQINTIEKSTDEYGKAFEHFIAMELRAYLSYSRDERTLAYWQAHNGQEVDFVIGKDIAIEVKTTTNPSTKHLKGLKALQEENIFKEYYLVCHTKHNTKKDNINVIDYKTFLKKLWSGKLV